MTTAASALTAAAAVPARAHTSIETVEDLADFQIDSLWRRLLVLRHERVRCHDALADAEARLPWWAAAGPKFVDMDGEEQGMISGYPAWHDVEPPAATLKMRVLRPNTEFFQKQLLFSRFRDGESVADAEYQANLRTLDRLRRDQEAERAKLDIPGLVLADDAASETLLDLEDEIERIRGHSATSVASRLLMVLMRAEGEVGGGLTANEIYLEHRVFVDIIFDMRPTVTGILREHLDEFVAAGDRPCRELSFWR